MVSSESTALEPDDIRVGMTAETERTVTEDDILAFAANSGDANPLHVDASYAASTSFGGRLAHGAYQVGLASGLLGMRLPGRYVLLTGVTARFPAPLRFPTTVRVRGVVAAWNRAAAAGRLRGEITDLATPIPTAEIDMDFP